MKETKSYKEKQVEIKCKILEDGRKLQEINFNDGSQISYVTFTDGGKMKINGEEFDMPAGTVVETKSVNGRVFSQLIQIPDMQKNVINKPEYLDKAEKILSETPEPQQPAEPPVMPKVEYIMKLLGHANSARALLYLSNKNNTVTDEMSFLKQNIAEGKLPKNTSITGVKEDGGKILTIPGDNCKFEVCGSEMRVINNNGQTRLVAKYNGTHESNGLWVVSYKNGKPVRGDHYTLSSTDKPLSSVTYTYNDDNTVTAAMLDSEGNNKTIKQNLPEKFCLNIDGEFKFVSSNQPHLGLVFENQTPFIET